MKTNYIFKPGDKVIIFKCDDKVDEMLELVNATCTIGSQTSGNWHGTKYNAYHIVEDKGKWFWREDWLLPADSTYTEFQLDENDIMNVFTK